MSQYRTGTVSVAAKPTGDRPSTPTGGRPAAPTGDRPSAAGVARDAWDAAKAAHDAWNQPQRDWDAADLASRTVTGRGTQWSNGAVIAGNLFNVTGSDAVYQIESVDSDTQITLTRQYAGVTESGATYAITSEFTPKHRIPYLLPGDDASAVLPAILRRVDAVIPRGIESPIVTIPAYSATQAYTADNIVQAGGKFYRAKSVVAAGQNPPTSDTDNSHWDEIIIAGAQGDVGTPGDSIRPWIAFADDTAGGDFSRTPTATSRYIGFAVGVQEPGETSAAWQWYGPLALIAPVADTPTAATADAVLWLDGDKMLWPDGDSILWNV